MRSYYLFLSQIIQQKPHSQMFEIREPSPLRFSRHEDDIKMEVNRRECGICTQKFKNEEFTKLCLCDHEFCQDCLKYYTLHKIRNEFALIQCPKENCKEPLDKQCQTFLNLPPNLKQRYERIVQNLKVLSNPSFKMCPNCDNSQLNLVKGQDNLLCTKCVQKFCKICLNPAHKKYAKCDSAVIGLLKRNFQMKRCINCMFIVEKNQGCNHMTCMCGFEFCYLCGGDWKGGNHECPPKPVYVRPRTVNLKRRQFPPRKTLTLVPLNIMFNPEVSYEIPRIKGNFPNKYHKFVSAVSKRQSEKRISLPSINNSFVINNVSILSQKCL